MKTELYSSDMRSHLTAKHVLLSLFYTAIFSFLIAGFLTIIDVAKPFVASLVMSLSIGLSMYLIMHLLFWFFNPQVFKILPKVLIMFGGIVGGMIMGFQIGPFLLRYFFAIIVDMHRWSSSIKNVVLALVISGTVTYFFYSQAHLRVIRETAEKERADRLAGEKAVLESNLRLLQAQIEPHFLFNTLSNVLSLIDTEPAKGKTMLTDLIHYLRTSLSRALPETTTLGQEIDMIKAYLSIQKIRMDERLNFTIDLPDTLQQHPFPPMLLQPLVENAIKHGIEPTIDGGTITIKAMKKGSLIRIEVIDTGIGLSTYQKNGVGIGNVKDRLQLLYGEKGRLILEENKPTGVRAIIEVPEHDI